VLGFIPSDILDRTVDAIVENNSRDLIETVGIIVDQGLNLQQFVRELISRMRDLLMVKLGLGEKVLGGDEEKVALARRAESFSEQDLIRYFDLLLRLETDVRWTSQPRFHLEIGLVKLAKAGHMRDIEEVIRDLKQGASPPVRAAATAPSVSSPARPAPVPSPTPRPAMPRSAPLPAPAPAVKSDIIKPAEPSASVDRRPSDSLMELVREEPIVKKFLETFRGDLAQVKPPKGEDNK
jgi:DNA polymerase-3 subunit gamma/tau